MDLDFRKLSIEDRCKALLNVLNNDISDKKGNLTFLAHLLGDEYFDIWGWFDIARSNEGIEYWIKLKDEQLKSK